MRRYTSVGLSPLVAVILLIAITVAAAVVVSGVFFNLAGIAGRRPTAIIDQIKLVAPPTGGGTFSVVLKNTGDVPIKTVDDPKVSFSTVTGCTFTGLTWTWDGSRNPGGTLYGVTDIDAAGGSCVLLGKTITVTITVFFADESQQVLTTGVTGAIA
jgi:flagellin-like protein